MSKSIKSIQLEIGELNSLGLKFSDIFAEFFNFNSNKITSLSLKIGNKNNSGIGVFEKCKGSNKLKYLSVKIG